MGLLGAIRSYVEQMFFTYDVETFSSPVGSPYDSARMQAIQARPTVDRALDTTVVRSMRCGVRRGERILRPEKVEMYRYGPLTQPEGRRLSANA